MQDSALSSPASQNSHWNQLFHEWPTKLPRKGIIVTTWDEQIPFQSFMSTSTLLLLERKIPDASGSRRVILPFEKIAAFKMTDMIDDRVFSGVGFQGDAARK